jgi:sulfite reductase alpha subunit-like flavoprotein
MRSWWNKVGVVYVCGSSGKMPTTIREALVEGFEKCGVWERETVGIFDENRKIGEV